MNKINIIGNLGRDAEVVESANGRKFLTLSVADNIFVRGEKKTFWYDITVFNYPEKAVQYYKKGAMVVITGTVYSDIEKTKDGRDILVRRINGDSIEFMPSKPDSGESTTNTTNSAKSETTVKKEETPSMYASREKKSEPVKTATVTTTSVDDDNDLPF